MKYKNITITKRQNENRYCARPTINKKTYYIYGNTQKECYNNLKEFFKKPITLQLDYKKIKLFEWLEEWVKTYKEPYIKPNSLKSIMVCINKHIKTNIENKQLATVTALEVDKALLKIESTKMRKETYNVYCESFRTARKNNLIKEDISLYINKVKHIEEPGRDLTEIEQKEFKEAIKNTKHRTMFLFYLYSGARASELSNLKWTDIHENYIHIPGTKTDGSDRIIPKFEILTKLLNETPKNSELVFNIQQRQLRREIKKINEESGLNFKLKDLRTTFTNNCVRAGISTEIISKWLGHTTTKTTKQYYIIEDKTKIDMTAKSIFDTRFDTI